MGHAHHHPDHHESEHDGPEDEQQAGRPNARGPGRCRRLVAAVCPFGPLDIDPSWLPVDAALVDGLGHPI